MKGKYKLHDFFCCLDIEAITTICLIITLFMLICCCIFLSDELFPFIAIVIILLATITPTAILLKNPQMLLPFIFATVLLIGNCLFLLVEFNMRNDNTVILKLPQITFIDEDMKQIRLMISMKNIKITLYFALLYFVMQLLSVYECIRHYKFAQLLREALQREDENNVEWMQNINGQCIQGSRQLHNVEISANKRTVVTPSAPPYMCAISASRPQPNLFPFPQGNNENL